MPIVTVAIEKGGVGKTATVVNLATIYAQQGFKVLVVDMDTQSNTTYFLTGKKKNQNAFQNRGIAEMLRVYGQGVDAMNYVQPTQVQNLFIIPSNAATASLPDILSLLSKNYDININDFLAYALAELSGKFDFVFIDTPPNLELATTNALVACDYVLIPFNCEEQALDGLQNTEEMRRRLEENNEAEIRLLGIVMTMVERAALTKEMRDALKQSTYGPFLFSSEIRKGQAVKDSATYGTPVVISARNSNPAKDYYKLADEILIRLKKERGKG